MKIGIIGGGAAGLMAAITAGAYPDREVTVFERQSRPGRKLLATGNGRCNLSNRNLSPENYHGADRAFAIPALDAFSVEDTLEFFSSLGLITVTEESGKVYPFSDQANSVLDVLRFAAREAGVDIRTGWEIKKISKKDDGFILKSDEGEIYADKVIVAAGGCAGGKLGGTNSGYELLRSLGHSSTKLYPSLVQLRAEEKFLRSLKGVRADAAVRIKRGKEILTESRGEVQFTDYGISGPAVFEISRVVSTESVGITAELDLMRALSVKDITSALVLRQSTMPGLTLEDILTGMLHNRLGRVLVKCAGFELSNSITGLGYGDLVRIAKTVKGLELTVTGTMGMDSAQVTAGGIRTGEFYPDTLESRLCLGLYAAGEVLDIDGDCGGYNLQWAWSSGRLAGHLKTREDTV